MTHVEIDDQESTTIEKARTWIAAPANVTRGWLLLSTLVGFAFVGCAIYAAVQTVQLDNRVTREQSAAIIQQQIATCELTNARRSEAKIVALADVAGDHTIWESIDNLFPDGIPQPARDLIFMGLDNREKQIESTYAQVDCSTIGVLPTDER